MKNSPGSALNFRRCSLLIALTALLWGATGLSPASADIVKYYTDNGDFDIGTFTATENQTIPNQIQLIPGQSETKPYMYIANHRYGSISKLDTRDGKEVARYPACLNGIGNNGSLCPTTHAQHRPQAYCDWSTSGHCPSRTTVDLGGDIWVANRAFGHQSSATKIAGELGHCVDRNGDGIIQTSSDLNGNGRIDVVENGSMPDSVAITFGQPATSEWLGQNDECVMFSVAVGTTNALARAMSIDGQNRVWVGFFNNGQATVLDANTGSALATYSYAPGNKYLNFYGFANDALGYMYNSELANGGRIAQIRTSDGALIKVLGAGGITYGLAAEKDTQRAWVADWAGGERLRRINFTTDTVNTFQRPGNSSGSWFTRGIAVANTGRVWMTYWHRNQASYYDPASGTWGPAFGIATGPIGVALDPDNNAWTANQSSSNATKCDPVAGTATPSVTVGVEPYSYSDMTGYQLTQGVVQQGSWTIVNDGGIEGLEWGTVYINEGTGTCPTEGCIPPGTKIEVEARWNNVPTFSGAWTKVQYGQEFTGQFGRYMQVRAVLRVEGLGPPSPVLTDMRVLPRGPSLTGFNPPSVPAGFHGTVELLGSNFTNELTADFGPGIAVESVFVNTSGSAVATITVGPDFAPGNVSVTVDNGAFDASNGSFAVTLASPAITSLSPSAVAPGSSVSMTITGSALAPSATFSASAGTLGASSYVDMNNHTASYTAPTTPQTVSITATNASGTSTATDILTVYGITSASGAPIEIGKTGTVTVTGVGLQGDEVASFGGGMSVLNATWNGGEVTYELFATQAAALGYHPASLTSPSLGLSHSVADAFQVVPLGGGNLPPPGCTDSEYQGRPYRVCTTPKSWTDAQTDCQSVDLELASVSHVAENEWVKSIVLVEGITEAWIGLHGSGGSYATWTNGQSVTYDAWATGQPALTEGCAYTSSGAWADANCIELRPFVCEGAVPSVAPELIALWYFNDGQGSSFVDTSGLGHDGSLVAPYGWIDSDLEDLFPSGNTSQGAAVRFIQDGFGEAAVGFAASSEATMEAWVALGSAPVTPTPIFELGEGQFIAVSQGAGGHVNVACTMSTDDGGQAVTATASAAFNPATNPHSWNHVACVFTGSALQLFRNGELADEQPLAGALTLSPGTVHIGGVPVVFDNVAYWSVALTPATVAAHAENGGITDNDGNVVGLPAPVVSSLSPSTAGPGQSATLAMTGANFTSATQLDLGPGVSIDDLRILNATSAEVDVTIDAAAALGNRNATVTTEYGAATLPAGLRVYGIRSLSPGVVQAGATNVTVAITGYGFTAADTIDFGAGVTASGLSVVDSLTAEVVLSVAANAVLGSRDVTVSNAEGATHTLSGVFTIAGDSVLVWTTQGDFAESTRSSVDIDSKPGSALIAPDNGTRDFDFTDGEPNSGLTTVTGAGVVTFTEGAGGLQISGFSGGNVQAPVPSGDVLVTTTFTVDDIQSDALEIFGFGPPGTFRAGKSYAQSGYAGLFMTAQGALGWYRRVANITSYWDGSQWTLAPATFGVSSLGVAIRAQFATRDGELTVSLTNAADGSPIDEQSTFILPGKTVFYLGSNAEFTPGGVPQFGAISFETFSIADPYGAFDAFAGPLDTEIWEAVPGTTTSGLTFSNGQAHASGTVVTSVQWPYRTDTPASAAVEVIPSVGAGHALPLFGLHGGTLHTGDMATWMNSLALVATASGDLALRAATDTTVTWWDGAAWTSSAASIPGTANANGSHFGVSVSVDTTGEVIVLLTGPTGNLITSATATGLTGITHAFLGSPVQSTAAPGAGSAAYDWFRAWGDIQGNGYQASGTIAVAARDAGFAPINYGLLSMGAALPQGTAVALQLRTGNDLATLALQPYLGPDGTENTVFSGGELIEGLFDGDTRYVSWRATMTTSDPNVSPELRDVMIAMFTVPTITSVSPNAGQAGQTLDVTITGTGFDSSSTVTIAGVTVLSTQVNSSTQIVVSVQMPGTATPGPRDVTVTTNGGVATLADGFQMGGLTGINTPGAEQGQTLVVQVTGIGFTSPIQADFGNGVVTDSVTLVDPQTVEVVLVVEEEALLGSRDVNITWSGATATLSGAFAIFPPENCPGNCNALGLTQVLPPVAVHGTQTTITLQGTFFGTDLVVIPSSGVSVVSVNPLTSRKANVTFSVPAAYSGNAFDLTLQRAGQEVTVPNAVKVLRIDSIAPGVMTTGATTSLVVTGSGFVNAAGVQASLGAHTSSVVTVQSETQITIAATATAIAALGPRNLTVNIGSAALTAVGAVQVHGAGGNVPDVTSVSPAQGERGQTYTITLTGTKFAYGMTANFGVGMAVSNLQVISGTQATLTLFVAPGTILGARDVSVTTLYNADILLNAFFVQGLPCDGIVCNTPPNPCYNANGTCDPANGSCSYATLPAGTPCNDGIDCTAGDTCNGNGVCGSPVNVDCNDSIPCTIDECDGIGGCVSTPEDAVCAEFTCPVGGDVNGSGKLNIADVLCFILTGNAIQAGNPMPSCIKGKSQFTDINCDGQTNVVDIQQGIRMALGLGVAAAVDHNENQCHDGCDRSISCGDSFCDTWESCLICPEDCGGCLGDCCTPNSTLGCNDETVMNAVCDDHMECCSTSGAGWTEACVGYAEGTGLVTCP